MKMNWQNKNNQAFLLIISAVIIMVLWSLNPGNPEDSKAVDNSLEDNNPVVEDKKEGTTTKTTTQKPAPKLSYQDAINKYFSTRIQFDGMCQARPYNQTYKTGTSIMLDNRSDQNRKIKVGGTTYNVPAYDYKIAKVSATVFPTTMYIDCDNRPKVATLIIQQ